VVEREERQRRLAVAMGIADDPALQQQVQFLAVHLDAAQLAPRLANKTLQVVVELEGSSLRQQVRVAQSDANGYVNFGATCLFPWHPEMAAVLRVHLCKVHHLMSRTIASKEVTLPSGSWTDPWQEVHSMMLFSSNIGRFVGNLHFEVEPQALSLAEVYSRAGGSSNVRSGQQVVAEPLDQHCRTSQDDLHRPLLALSTA